MPSLSHWESPLFYIGALLIVASPFLGYAILLAFGCGALLILVDHFSRRWVRGFKRVLLIQMVVIALLGGSGWLGYTIFANQIFTVTVVAPKNYQGNVGIVFGIEGFPVVNDNDTLRLKNNQDSLILTSTSIRPSTKLVFNTILGETPHMGQLLLGPPECDGKRYELRSFSKTSRHTEYWSDPKDPSIILLDSLLAECR